MFLKKTGLTCIAALALEAAAFAQAPPPPPAAPSTPKAPRAVRGYSVTTPGMNSRRGYLGVGVAEITEDRAKALKLSNDSGVEVKHVDDDSPASKAGLKESDVILEVNNQKVDDVEQFVKSIGD